MRRVWALTVAVVVLTVCAGTAAASDHRSDTATPGVTSNQITLGVTYVDLSQLQSVVNINFGDWRKIYQAVINDLDAKGGINGRKVVPDYAPVQPVGTVPAEDACVKLTEDDHVFAVTGFFLADAPLCYLNDQHRTPVINGTITAQYLAQAKAPWFSLEPTDSTYSEIIDAFAADGAFKGGKVGIEVDLPSQNLYNSVIAPALKRNHVSGPVATITATTGDAVATQQQASVIATKFQSQGINKIVLVGTSALQFAQALEQTNYRPRLIVPNYASLSAYVQAPGNTLDVAATSLGAFLATNFHDPALQQCFQVVTRATGYNIQEVAGPGQPDYRSSATIACDSIGLFAAIARAAGRNLNVASFGQAAQKAGSFNIPGYGTITYNAKTHSFNTPVYIYRYNPALKALVPDPKPAT
jgi:hypothetical protein